MPKTDKKVIFQLHFWSMTNTLENIDKVFWVETLNGNRKY